MTPLDAVALFVAALIGSALNSVAGGGSFIAFPTLLFTGVAPINANATTTVSLWLGSVSSVGAYRSQMGSRQRALFLGGASFIGGALGAILLLRTPQAEFQRLIPYLLLVATLLFTFSGHVTVRLRALSGHSGHSGQPTWRTLVGVSAAQLVIATYGGFFGGGIGILMLATLSLMGLENIHTMNALKTLLASCINGVAVVIFIVAGAVAWAQALVMLVAAILGGFAGAYYARRIDPLIVRRFVMLVGSVLTVYFFIVYR